MNLLYSTAGSATDRSCCLESQQQDESKAAVALDSAVRAIAPLSLVLQL